MKALRLSEDDYLTIYPLAKPIEIREEFGEHSHCIAQIRNKYKKLRFNTQAQALKLLKNELHLLKPNDVGFAAWEREINAELEKAKQAAFSKVRARLEDRLRLYGDDNG